LPGENEKKDHRDEVRGAVDDAFDLVRSQRTSRRNLYLLLGLFILLVVARQMGFFGETHEGMALPRVELEETHALLADAPILPVLGEPDAPVRIIEFFDYACGHCRRMAPIVDEAVALNEDVSLVLIELPILGRESQIAARYALAAELQGGYGPFHRALMFSAVPYTDEGLMELGANLDLDPDRLKADAYGPVVDEALVHNREIAGAVGVEGTPSFVIGDVFFVGAVDKASFLGLIASQKAELAEP